MTLTTTYLFWLVPPGMAAAVAYPRESFAVVVVVVALVLALVVVLVRRAGTRGGVHFSTVARMRTAASPPTYAAVPGPEKNRPEGGA